jgi:uncharacterized membrane protein
MTTLQEITEWWIGAVALGIDLLGVAVIVGGITWSTFHFLLQHMSEQHYYTYKSRIGRSLLLGLEMLVAADIVKTIALEATFTSLGVLAGLVVVRTFLSWTLVIEVDGRWPWQIKNQTQREETA